MRLLCVHQNFPGQFRDLAPALVERGHELKAISSSERISHPDIEILRYELPKPERSGIHQLTMEVDEWIRRSELAARQAEILRQRGWAPDVILAHPGWGESLLLRDVFPTTPQVLWPELWLQPEHMGVAPGAMGLEQKHYLRCKNSLLDAALAEADAVITPTRYQAASFPARWQGKMQLIHEGVPEAMFTLPRLASLSVGPDITLGPGLPVVSFISRNLEPMRGFPQFMRALPKLQALSREVQVVIVGGHEVSYSSAPANGQNWKHVLLEELDQQLDHTRIHWFGRMPHEELIKLYRRSDLHVYLSEAFVLSWSLTEILACGTPVLAQANPMVKELIQPGVNGALFQGSPSGLGEAMAQLLEDRSQLQSWGAAGRQQLQREFRQEHCLQVLEQLLMELANRF
ncbi:glycosyltransferase [Cyanobium sp. HWJ4-Hawea]|uniref:glycosyltransferase n=1 Tax=Cyanobium sp. HWJ4-Hawea TaxID=2823713 RepID=UPI0020CE08CD|nr:glycosyltransferase [Cyanobium sp. HWJ4-Hawea]MCP9809129.1 glycosyltransferase [Cyanobium sp. HWJ4-Hawea]